MELLQFVLVLYGPILPVAYFRFLPKLSLAYKKMFKFEWRDFWNTLYFNRRKKRSYKKFWVKPPFLWEQSRYATDFLTNTLASDSDFSRYIDYFKIVDFFSSKENIDFSNQSTNFFPIILHIFAWK